MHHGQSPLDGAGRLHWMDMREAGQAGNFFIQARVVFHGAGAERKKGRYR